MTHAIRQFLKRFIPARLLLARARYLHRRALRRHDEDFKGRPAGEIFSEIYSRALWGKGSEDAFFSGHGSHLPSHVEPYVEAVSAFLGRFDPPLDVVDLGCGDFNVGRKIRAKAAGYVACDVVPDLIRRNREVFGHLAVDFRVVDIIDDELPGGDVVIIRQVLQHLSNADIRKVVGKLAAFRYLVLTEYVPAFAFVPNVDMPTGPFSRLARGVPSGIVLTAPPFNLQPRSSTLICETPEETGTLQVIVYEF